ncbi:hypothetical protein QEN19_001174 [Hanseniaspora menglaensis]
MTQPDGASFEEQLLSVPNLDNLSLFKSIEKEIDDIKKFSVLINSSVNTQGQPFLYLLCFKAAWDTINYILDTDSIELDDSVVTEREGDSCIHGILEYIVEEQDFEIGEYILENLIECGFNVSIKNKKNQTPLDYYLERNGGKADDVVDILMSAGFFSTVEQGDKGEEVDELDED